ncbi:hypothetical protein [Paenibacillus sp. sgz500958]|uniref:hypothetical protein n=1 Tax=Paenibacillus sp. sgz500958 TaxID=3242475 RepID=UPI0036D23FCA
MSRFSLEDPLDRAGHVAVKDAKRDEDILCFAFTQTQKFIVQAEWDRGYTSLQHYAAGAFFIELLNISREQWQMNDWTTSSVRLRLEFFSEYKNLYASLFRLALYFYENRMPYL